MERLKILVMGPTSAGKTSIIRQVLYGLESKELASMEPTMLIKVHPDYTHRNYLCKFFDTGGQEMMFNEYYRPEREMPLFSKVDIFLYVVDSGDPQRIRLARKEFWRSMRKITKYSPKALPVILAHKQDLKVHLPPEEVSNILIEPDRLINEAYLPKDPQERRQVEKTVKRIQVYGTSIEDPVKNFYEHEAYWTRSDEAVIEILDKYKKLLRDMMMLGEGVRKLYPEEFLNYLVFLLKDFDRTLGSLGSVILDKLNSFIIATTLRENEITGTTLGNIIAHSAMILEERERDFPGAIILRGEISIILMQSINEEIAFLTALQPDKQFEEEELLTIVERFVDKIRNLFKTIS
ncbi:MAG: ADP-ribosylation factor-like protein [Candidatus Lokiarchaeia archaeon]